MVDDAKQAYYRAQYERHKEANRARARRYREEHYDEVMAKMKVHYQENRAEILVRQREQYQKHKEKRRSYAVELHSTPEGRTKEMLTKCKKRAREIGVAFERDAVLQVIQERPSSCPCCGTIFNLQRGLGFERRHAAPSVDRLDSNKGYVSGNLAIICWHCNALKRDATSAQLKRIVDWLSSLGY